MPPILSMCVRCGHTPHAGAGLWPHRGNGARRLRRVRGLGECVAWRLCTRLYASSWQSRSQAARVQYWLCVCVCETGKGVGFKKRPDEGRMKGLAFALDPDGYWVEIIKRPETHVGDGGYVLNQARCTLPTPPTPTHTTRLIVLNQARCTLPTPPTPTPTPLPVSSC